MKTDIVFDGINTVPSDYDCEDGALSACFNGLNVDGNVRPVWPSKKIGLTPALGNNDQTMYIHKTGDYEHFIVLNTSDESQQLWWGEIADSSLRKARRRTPSSISNNDTKTVGGSSYEFPSTGEDDGTGGYITSCNMQKLQWYKYTAKYKGIVMFSSSTGQMNLVQYTLEGEASTSRSFTFFQDTEDSDRFEVEKDNVIYLCSTVDQTIEANITIGEEFDIENAIPANNGKHTIATYDTELEIYQVSSIGNTLLVLTNEGMHYYLWDDDTQAYKDLGTHIPELPISFGLNGYVVQSEKFTFRGDGYVSGWESIQIPNEEGENDFSSQSVPVNAVTSQVLAQVNKFIQNWSTNKGKFIFPFFVRYAYKLYDGSTTMASVPVLMLPSTEITPLVRFTHDDGDAIMNHFYYYIYAAVCNLDYQVQSYTVLKQLREDWKDIVTGINIYVSAPIYTYDQAGKIESLYVNDTPSEVKNTACLADIWGYVDRNKDKESDRKDDVISPVRWQIDGMAKGKCYRWQSIYETCYKVFNKNLNNWTTEVKNGWLVLPRKEDETIHDKIANTNLFYLLKSFDIDEIECQENIDEIINAIE